MDDMTVSVKMVDKSPEYLEDIKKAKGVILEALGQTVERYAKEKCTVDTGLLRNSITHSLSGQSISKSYHADYGSGSKNGKRARSSSKNAGSVKIGQITGTMGTENEQAVYVGTNVEYAPYVEMGHHTPAGNYVPPKPYLKPAVTEHQKEFENIIKAHMPQP